MPRLLVLVPFLLFAALLTAPASAQSTCPARLLVSDFEGTVLIFDACTGAALGPIETTTRIRGPQAIRRGADGMLYIVSEQSGQVLRYRADTLAYEGVAATPGGGFGATGVDIAPNGEIWVGGYNYDGVRRYDRNTGAILGDAIAPRTAGLDGPDNGLVFGPDGKLYVPGYDSNSVVRQDPATGQVTTLVAARAGNLFRTRGILFEPGGATFLVTSEGNGKVLRYRTDTGAFVAEVIGGLSVPTGIAYNHDGKLLVLDSAGVRVYDPTTYAAQGVLVSGGIGGGTYVAVIPNAATVDESQVGTQYWLSGTAAMTGRTLTVADAISTNGARFGASFRPADVAIERWGSLRIEFTSCRAGTFSWDSPATGGAGFGTGSYAIERLLPNELTADCEQQGFANANDLLWIMGTWYGGASRNGEGLFIDKTADGRPFVAWFTYRPNGID